MHELMIVTSRLVSHVSSMLQGAAAQSAEESLQNGV